MATTARAHTNIALVKYWGKRDAALMLPQTDSLSLTLDEFYTTTTVNFNQALNEDQFYLDGDLVSANKAQKVVKFMDLVRQLSGPDCLGQQRPDGGRAGFFGLGLCRLGRGRR